jgi:hypothetical protein
MTTTCCYFIVNLMGEEREELVMPIISAIFSVNEITFKGFLDGTCDNLDWNDLYPFTDLEIDEDGNRKDNPYFPECRSDQRSEDYVLVAYRQGSRLIIADPTKWEEIMKKRCKA